MSSHDLHRGEAASYLGLDVRSYCVFRPPARWRRIRAESEELCLSRSSASFGEMVMTEVVHHLPGRVATEHRIHDNRQRQVLSYNRNKVLCSGGAARKCIVRGALLIAVVAVVILRRPFSMATRCRYRSKQSWPMSTCVSRKVRRPRLRPTQSAKPGGASRQFVSRRTGSPNGEAIHSGRKAKIGTPTLELLFRQGTVLPYIEVATPEMNSPTRCVSSTMTCFC